eukprot:TRINITY_DN18626_c0_g1_i5.p1 TRINITY_DN18626_c0_g1~~TRINITY_DN18626_c0_g1_i5.p1  ORF type:complete len:466 (+),score=87.63 TRINITY_DN18626_c0_g1_i5:162-1559(+)
MCIRDRSREYRETTEENCDMIQQLLDPAFMEHDAFAIFSKVMEGMHDMYATPGPSQTSTASALRSQMHALGGRGENVNLAVKRCQRVHHLLERADPEVFGLIAKQNQIEPQLYVLRWLRLMFTREFHIDDVMLIWDAVLADSASFKLMDYLAVSMIVFIRENLLAFDDVSQLLARLMKYPPVESIMVIVDKALVISGNSDPSTNSSSYGHMPRKATALPVMSLPTPSAAVVTDMEEDAADPLSAMAHTVVKGTKDLWEDVLSPISPGLSKSGDLNPANTGFTPRPSSSNEALAAFESPKSSSISQDAEDFGISPTGQLTHRKVSSSFGPGVAATDCTVAATEVPVLTTPPEMFTPVEPKQARFQMQELIHSWQQAPSQALELLDGALNWKDEQTREHHRALAERVDECLVSLQAFLSAAQMFVEPGEQIPGQDALPGATDALSQLEAIKSCLILGGELPPKAAKF